jgi:hypothetical protein
MTQDSTQRKVPPAVFVGGFIAIIVSAVAGVAVFEAASATGASGRAEPVERVLPVARVEAGSVREQVAQTAQHQDVGLLAMAPMYAPAVVGVELFGGGEDVRPVKATGFFVGPGRLAVPRSAAAGAVRGEVVLDVGRRFPVERIVADAPEVDLVLLTIDLPSELMRGLQVAFLEPLPGESLLALGAAGDPGAEDPRHPMATVAVERVRIDETLVKVQLEGELPVWSLGAPLLNETGKLAGYVARGQDDALTVFGAERLLRLEPLPGLSLAEWTGGTSVSSTKPPPETEDLWAEIRALPRPEGFGPAPKEFGGYDVRPAKIEVVEGELVLDGRFKVAGSGTQADPYVLPWALMMSAGETFNPSRGKLVLPERVTMFDGRWVRFEGNLAIPFAERFVSELLLMQHPWDGCCLGVPPTPYDAIEVSLAAPIEHRPQFGVVTGRLKVDPFVRGQWLYGMYLMEGASLSKGDASEDN